MTVVSISKLLSDWIANLRRWLFSDGNTSPVAQRTRWKMAFAAARVRQRVACDAMGCAAWATCDGYRPQATHAPRWPDSLRGHDSDKVTWVHSWTYAPGCATLAPIVWGTGCTVAVACLAAVLVCGLQSPTHNFMTSRKYWTTALHKSHDGVARFFKVLITPVELGTCRVTGVLWFLFNKNVRQCYF